MREYRVVPELRTDLKLKTRRKCQNQTSKISKFSFSSFLIKRKKRKCKWLDEWKYLDPNPKKTLLQRPRCDKEIEAIV